MTTITIRHPNAHLLADTGRGVVGTYTSVVAGYWAAVADLCADKIEDLPRAQQALNDVAQTSGYKFVDIDVITGVMTERVLDDGAYEIVSGGEGSATRAIDLFTRIICGQWSNVAFESGLSAGEWSDFDQWSLDRMRGQLCRTRADYDRRPLRADEFPAHPHASVGIAESTLPAKVGYHAFKMLGGGAAGGPTFSLPDGPLVVEVDSVAVNRIREY